MVELGGKTKFGFAKAAHKVARHCAEQEPEKLLAKSDQAKNWAVVASSVHGWTQSAANESKTLNIDVLTQGRSCVRVSTSTVPESGKATANQTATQDDH